MAQIYYSGPNRQPVIVDDSVLPSLIQNGTVTAATLVWKEGMGDWKPLRDVRPDLASGGTGGPAAGLPPLHATPLQSGQQRSHDVDFQLIGEEMQIIEIELDPGETVIAEAGSMNYMDQSIKFETKMGDGSNPKSGFWDKMKQVGKRVFTGESLFMTHFTNHGAGVQLYLAF